MRFTVLLAAILMAAPPLRGQQAGYQPLPRMAEAVRAGRATFAGPLATRIAIGYEGASLASALDDIARKSHIGIAYADDVARAPRISVAPAEVTAGEALLRVTRGTGFSAWVGPAGEVVVRRDDGRAAGDNGETARLSGYVRRADNREWVRYAAVSTLRDSLRTSSNADGYWFLRVPAGSQRLRVRAPGFVPLDTVVEARGALTLEFELTPATATLASVDIAGARDAPDIDPRTPDMSVARLDLSTIRQAPAILGEVDPVRSLALLPGVSRATDFSTAFNVRGGGADQNLVLLDESTIYNPAHIFGLLSVFNPDAIDDVTLHKGAIPARFGGRLSSVLDVRQREGNAKQLGGTASIGLLASRALLEGPLPGTRGSFLIAARRSYADAFLPLASDTTVRKSSAYFYDLNAKMNVPVGTSGAVMLSGYLGRDAFGFGAQPKSDWGNVSGTLRWQQILGERLFSKISLTGSSYDYGLGFNIVSTPSKWNSSVRSTALRADETWSLSERNVIEFGGDVAGLEVRPGDLQPSDTVKIRPVRVFERQGRVWGAYVGHNVDLGDRISVRYGLRLSAFERLGPGLTYQYAGGQPVRWNSALTRFEPAPVIDSTRAGAGSLLSRFHGWEPRASLRVGLDATSSLKLSYARTRQYLLLASRTNAPTPLDVWEPVGPYLKPQQSDQVALGYAATFGGGAYEFSAEVYGKTLDNVAEFVDGSDVVLNPRIETAIVQGDGRAAGLELFVRKTSGRVTGWISYTLSRAERRVLGGSNSGINGGINGGNWFVSPTDKTHDLSVVGVVPLNGRWTLGTTFTLSSGLPVTYPVSRYQVDGILVPEYGDRNAARLPLYHRLDLSLTRTYKRGELQFGLYNVYNRQNAQSMAFRQVDKQPLATEAVQLSIFGVVPSISYTWHF